MSDTQDKVVEETTKLVDVTDKLNESLIKMIEGLEDGAAFLGAEIPEYITQLLMWNLARNALMCLLGVVMLSIIIPYIKFIWNKARNMHPSEGDALKMFAGGLGTFVLFFTGTNFVNLEWLQIWLAPKVWLVEYITTLVK
jgi:hypothetical protein